MRVTPEDIATRLRLEKWIEQLVDIKEGKQERGWWTESGLRQEIELVNEYLQNHLLKMGLSNGGGELDDAQKNIDEK